jgi:hypothetical protein
MTEDFSEKDKKERGRRIETETPAAMQAFEDYYNSGAKRSLAKLSEFYRLQAEQANLRNDLEKQKLVSLGKPIPPELEKVHKPLAALQTLELWSTSHDWQERIKSRLDVEREEQIRLQVFKRKQRAEERLKQGSLMQQVGLAIIEKAKINEMKTEEARTKLGLAMQFLQSGMQVERLELGETGESLLPSKPIADMTDEELDDYAAKLQAEADKSVKTRK